MNEAGPLNIIGEAGPSNQSGPKNSSGPSNPIGEYGPTNPSGASGAVRQKQNPAWLKDFVCDGMKLVIEEDGE